MISDYKRIFSIFLFCLNEIIELLCCIFNSM